MCVQIGFASNLTSIGMMMKERSFDFSKVNRVFVWWTILCRGSHLVITSLSIFVTVKAFKSSKGRLDFNFAAWEVHSSLSKSLVPHFLEEERLLKLYKTPRESVLSLNKIVVQAGCRKTSIWIFRFSCRVLSDFYIVKKKKKEDECGFVNMLLLDLATSRLE